jgi:hypothetical protein
MPSLLQSFIIQLARIELYLRPKPHAPGEKKPQSDALPERKR